MTDEANSHYFATIMEMIEGHEFVRNQLGFLPTSHWSIDPFGLSPTLAYLLNRSNLTHMAIQRVHYSAKKYLAKQKALEFRWRQMFAGDSATTDITTHAFPFFSYDVPHTCGPDPKVCCQFDFRRLHQFFCPWGKPPIKIDSSNVAERAELLADQYRKKAQLYKENTLLIPLGDDFRYDTDSEWNDQYTNYIQLMKYMNERQDWNIHVRFGTLADYFSVLDRRLAEENTTASTTNKLPILSGDFFTYADRDDHYWSGYFTSRPFYKHMDRTLQHYLRSADILFTLASSQAAQHSGHVFSGADLYNELVEARRALSLFQHHDGVTGTAKSYVVEDYGRKMLSAIKSCKEVISSASEYLMKFPHTREEKLRIDEEHFVDKLPRKIVTEDGSSVLVFNSLGHARQEVTCIHVTSSKSRISVADSKNHQDEILQQIGPVFYATTSGNLAAFKDKFELCFLAKLPPIGFVRYDIIEADDISHKARIHSLPGFASPIFETKELSGDSEIYILNSHLKAVFDSKSGYLKSVASKAMSDQELQMQMNFVRYGARPHNTSRNGDSLSGAYLFLPDGPARPLAADQNVYVLVEGPVRQYIFVIGPTEFGIQQTVYLDVNSQSLSINNGINLAAVDTSTRQRLQNDEVAMRLIVPSLEQEDKFYTDLNGFQMIRRRRFAKLPLQAQFYPMSGAMFVEDTKLRVSLLGRQALGAASLQPGWMEVMLDRRLVSDDDRGLGQGVLDNLLTQSQFHLLVESFSAPSTKPKDDESTMGYHSLSAHHISFALHYPPIVIVGQVDHASSGELLSTYSGLDHQLPCDVHMVALRTTSQPTHYGQGVDLGARSTAPETSAALVFHRLGADCKPNTLLQTNCESSFGKVSLTSIFKKVSNT
uniref:Alpha-mannosidase n=1 Tax=Ditylenchus dipsaci TaxID=166011 RepID=A0A915DCI5_9BILA